jgi:hypothetical protein
MLNWLELEQQLLECKTTNYENQLHIQEAIDWKVVLFGML